MQRLLDWIVTIVSLTAALVTAAASLITTLVLWVVGWGALALAIAIPLVIILLPFMLFQ